MENTQEEISSFLDNLRDSGQANMWGALGYVKSAFPQLPSKEAKEMTMFWMKHPGKRQ